MNGVWFDCYEEHPNRTSMLHFLVMNPVGKSPCVYPNLFVIMIVTTVTVVITVTTVTSVTNVTAVSSLVE